MEFESGERGKRSGGIHGESGKRDNWFCFWIFFPSVKKGECDM